MIFKYQFALYATSDEIHRKRTTKLRLYCICNPSRRQSPVIQKYLSLRLKVFWYSLVITECRLALRISHLLFTFRSHFDVPFLTSACLVLRRTHWLSKAIETPSSDQASKLLASTGCISMLCLGPGDRQNICYFSYHLHGPLADAYPLSVASSLFL